MKYRTELHNIEQNVLCARNDYTRLNLKVFYKVRIRLYEKCKYYTHTTEYAEQTSFLSTCT